MFNPVKMFCLEINEASVKAKIRSRMIVNHLLHSSAPIKDTICLFDLSITNAVNLQNHGFKPLTLQFFSRDTREKDILIIGTVMEYHVTSSLEDTSDLAENNNSIFMK